jgi:enoyl-CoA hydratase/carnithine racemase
MLALAHDFRIMKDDRALFWMPEVDIKLPFSPGFVTFPLASRRWTIVKSRHYVVLILLYHTVGMSKILTEKLADPQVIRDVMFFGKRYSSKEALQAKIVDELVPTSRVLARSIEIVQALASKAADRYTLKIIKEGVYKDLIPVLQVGPTPENHPAAARLAKM